MSPYTVLRPGKPSCINPPKNLERPLNMKMTFSLKDIFFRSTPLAALGACVLLAGATPLYAGDAKVPVTTEEPTFSNWVELGTGGMIYNGNHAQGQQVTGMTEGMFGGINDMHVEKMLGDKWFAKLDGRAIFGNNDYDLKLDISKPDVGYFRAGYKEFRAYYNGMGGFYPNKALPGDGLMVPANNDDLYVDRGDVWAEFGLRMPSLPEITIRYDHQWRDGVKDSTSWGDVVNNTGPNMLLAGASTNTRKIVPAFRELNEKRDIFTADVKQTFGNTDVGVGARVDLIHNDDSFYTGFQPGENYLTKPYTDVKLDRYLTQENVFSSDAFSTHATTETRFGEKLWFNTGYSYTTLNSNIGGSRIYGPNYNSPYLPMYGVSSVTNPLDPALPLYATTKGRAWIDVLGGSEVSQNEFNVNLLYMPIPQLSVITGFRFDQEDTDSVSSFTETNVNTKAMAYFPYLKTTTSHGHTTTALATGTVTYFAPTQTPYISSSDYALQKLAENFEVRFTGLKDWVLYTRVDLDADQENQTKYQRGAIQVQQYQIDPTTGKKVTTITVPGSIASGTTTINDYWTSPRMIQKYTTGFNWYPLQMLSFSGQYYYKNDHDKEGDDYIYSQEFVTNDVNFRITARPLSNLSFVSRYDLQQIDTYTSALDLGPQKSATQTNHMFTETVTWNPLDRLYLQANASYVLNNTHTDASDIIPNPTSIKLDAKGNPVIDSKTGLPTILPYVPGGPVIGPIGFSFKNNYWTAGLGAGLVVDEKTELHADYTYYRADDYSNNNLFANTVVISQPYGAGQEEQTVSASIQRQLCRNARLTLKYAFTSYRDQTSYGYGNFNSHLISTSVMVRF